MTILTKHVTPYGFKGSGMYDHSPSYMTYYKADAKANTITVLSSYTPDTLSLFKLTTKQFKQFKNGKLGIIPPGCCNASGRPALERHTILHEGDFKNAWHLKRVLKDLNIKPL